MSNTKGSQSFSNVSHITKRKSRQVVASKTGIAIPTQAFDSTVVERSKLNENNTKATIVDRKRPFEQYVIETNNNNNGGGSDHPTPLLNRNESNQNDKSGTIRARVTKLSSRGDKIVVESEINE